MFRLLFVEFYEGTEVYFMALGPTFCVWLVNPFYTESMSLLTATNNIGLIHVIIVFGDRNIMSPVNTQYVYQTTISNQLKVEKVKRDQMEKKLKSFFTSIFFKYLFYLLHKYQILSQLIY